MPHPNWTLLKTLPHSEHRIMQVRHDYYRFEPTGAELFVYGHVAGQPIRCVFRGRPAIEVGQSLRLSVSPDQVHLFDQKTGQRL